MTTPLHLTAADGFSFPAYVARPQGPAHDAIVVLQEIFGVNAHIRAVADSYAAPGVLQDVAASVLAFLKAQNGVQVQIYPAQHGFNCDHRGSYNADAAQLARERTLSFFAQHLR